MFSLNISSVIQVKVLLDILRSILFHLKAPSFAFGEIQSYFTKVKLVTESVVTCLYPLWP